MQVFCKASATGGDVQCGICGQGFLVYGQRGTPEQLAEARHNVQQALRDHHDGSQEDDAHPPTGFNVPHWDGAVAFSGAAPLGNAQAATSLDLAAH